MYQNDYADVMKYVSKPFFSSVASKGQNASRLHFNSAGELMIGASSEIELVRQQQAEEFVKKIQDEKERFEKKIKDLEVKVSQKEKSEIERLKAQEEKIELERMQKKRSELEDHLKKIKERGQERLKRKTEEEEVMKKTKQQKPLFAQLEERYHKEQELPALEEKKQRLKEIRELHRPLNHSELVEHEKKVMKYHEEQQAKFRASQTTKASKSHSVPINTMLLNELLEQKHKHQLQQEAIKKNREKVQEFSKTIKKPTPSAEKEEEMKQLIEKLKEQTKSKRSTKADDPEKMVDENELNMLRTKKLQNLVLAKNLKKYETIEEEREAKKDTEKPEPSTISYQNYWTDVKKKYNIQAHTDDWKNIISSKELSKKDKTEAILIEAEKLEEKAKMKEEIWKAKKGKKDNLKAYVDEADEVDDYYINSIKAKLSLLNDTSVSPQKAQSKNQTHGKNANHDGKNRRAHSQNNRYDSPTDNHDGDPYVQGQNYQQQNGHADNTTNQQETYDDDDE